jgi:hypothetical protein
MDASKFANDEYNVGWICALHEEFDIATAILDNEQGIPHSLPGDDTNAYTLGERGAHNVVTACCCSRRQYVPHV